MSSSRSFCAGLAAAMLTVSAAKAAVVTDQEQPLINEEAGFLGVGGDDEQKLAQSFTVGVDGDLVGLRLPIAGCGRGDLVLELRELDGGLPNGRLIRAARVPEGDVPPAYDGFQDFYFPTAIAVSAGDELAFTVQTDGEGSFCSYATAPDGDTYPRGEGFFDSRPNPPGWLSFKDFPAGPQDLAFFTLMDDPAAPGRSAGRCVIPGRIDPATGLPLELPISRYTPACRCFRDDGLREFRCGILHPDFFVIRTIPVPLIPGRPYEEIWSFASLGDLDGPVRITLQGGGFEKPVQLIFPLKQKLSAKKVVAGKGVSGESLAIKATAPDKPMTVPGLAVIEYDMKDPASDFQTRFGLDTTLEEDLFGQ